VSAAARARADGSIEEPDPGAQNSCQPVAPRVVSLQQFRLRRLCAGSFSSSGVVDCPARNGRSWCPWCPGGAAISALRDPYRLHGSGYLLDQDPDTRMGPALQRMDDGDRIVLAKVGRGYAWERTGEPVAGSLVKALLTRDGSASRFPAAAPPRPPRYAAHRARPGRPQSL
jgi:hypothetical protein